MNGGLGYFLCRARISFPKLGSNAIYNLAGGVTVVGGISYCLVNNEDGKGQLVTPYDYIKLINGPTYTWSSTKPTNRVGLGDPGAGYDYDIARVSVSGTWYAGYVLASVTPPMMPSYDSVVLDWQRQQYHNNHLWV